jgi:C-terminal processing protease CtpA/Prc
LAELLAGKLEPWQLARATIQGMADALQSPTTLYVAPEQARVPQAQAEYAGVRVSLHPALVVTDVFPGCPARTAGVRAGDQPIAIDGLAVDGLPA